MMCNWQAACANILDVPENGRMANNIYRCIPVQRMLPAAHAQVASSIGAATTYEAVVLR